MRFSPTSDLLLYADSARNPDMRYFSGIHVPDAFIAFQSKRKRIGIFNALEYGRALKESSLDQVLPLEPLRESAKQRWRTPNPSLADIILVAAGRLRIRHCFVADDFPAALFMKLKKRGLRIDTAHAPILPSREIKSASEARAIRAANGISAAGIRAAERMLSESRIKGRNLIHRGRTLTSEMLRMAIEIACIEAGGVSIDTIAAGGDQACDPHHRGSGPIRPHELIIIDVFPKANKSSYHGDMTRTFLKGRANDAQRSLVEAVASAQKKALRLITSGANGREVHRACDEEFRRRGYETKSTPRGSVGFFHGTGHGLGLAVHELPRISGMVDSELRAGAVVTVEPGLYYPGIGGCRIEDVVQVTSGRPRMLSSYPYRWEIR
ncbi:MAG TPA: Xaa-Pro peptidase family protein [Opitutaceae bacterium]|nr:Xaa-Pro peptidase family protein [Opitutaceae bacterium]